MLLAKDELKVGRLRDAIREAGQKVPIERASIYSRTKVAV